ncbi:MAG: hypothetical protein ACE5JG_04800 [Planctomycetota bacterium]
MSNDPVKLYVALMTILLAILGFVAATSYQQAQAYADALELAPSHARKIRELGAEVAQMCTQLAASDLRNKRPKAVVESKAKQFGIVSQRLGETPRPQRIAGKIKERRYYIEIGRKNPIPRETFARFCSQVERSTNGILKTIEVRLDRIGSGGKSDEVTDDVYHGKAIFGFRFSEE